MPRWDWLISVLKWRIDKAPTIHWNHGEPWINYSCINIWNCSNKPNEEGDDLFNKLLNPTYVQLVFTNQNFNPYLVLNIPCYQPPAVQLPLYPTTPLVKLVNQSHWGYFTLNTKNAMMPVLLWLLAEEIVIMTVYSATSDKVCIMTTLECQWMGWFLPTMLSYTKMYIIWSLFLTHIFFWCATLFLVTQMHITHKYIISQVFTLLMQTLILFQSITLWKNINIGSGDGLAASGIVLSCPSSMTSFAVSRPQWINVQSFNYRSANLRYE